MNTSANKALLERLSRSQIYKNYEHAFSETTGLPLTLSPVEDWHLAHHGRRHENPFCAILAQQNKTCAACLQTQHLLSTGARDEARSVTCFAGLRETAIPLRVGDNLVGFLRTGEVLLRKPNGRLFSRVLLELRALGIQTDESHLRELYFRTQVFSPKQYESVVQLLSIFAQHLSIVVNQLMLQNENAEPESISRARAFIDANYTEDLSLDAVAQAAHMSRFHFCKQFKKSTGLNYTDYLGRVRVEKAKQRLVNPHARVSEVAYEVGFQSLTHFNRVFRKLNGESPTEYRTGLPFAAAA